MTNDSFCLIEHGLQTSNGPPECRDTLTLWVLSRLNTVTLGWTDHDIIAWKQIHRGVKTDEQYKRVRVSSSYCSLGSPGEFHQFTASLMSSTYVWFYTSESTINLYSRSVSSLLKHLPMRPLSVCVSPVSCALQYSRHRIKTAGGDERSEGRSLLQCGLWVKGFWFCVHCAIVPCLDKEFLKGSGSKTLNLKRCSVRFAVCVKDGPYRVLTEPKNLH